uniref:WAP domain-containing protein n=1 Tax=Panagrellus redivivus TaxID=6233 RepID=A0A7E5A231_PANRE
MLKLASFVVLVALVCGWQDYHDDNGHPIADDEYDGDIELAGYPDGVKGRHCPPCHENKVNRKGDVKCVLIENCCPHLESPVKCIVDPCLFFRETCPRARHCVPSNCHSSGCKAVYYDHDFTLLPAHDCRVTVHSRHSRRPTIVSTISHHSKPTSIKAHSKQPKISTHSSKPASISGLHRVKIDLPSNLSHPSDIHQHRPHGKAVSVPRVVELHGAEKPGACPSIQYNHIIRVCVTECKSDKTCPHRQKCCFNGCAHRCQDPLEHRRNFLNYPIHVQGVKDTHGKREKRRLSFH